MTTTITTPVTTPVTAISHTADQELFIEYAETKSHKIRTVLALKNQKLVTYVVNKFYNKKREHKELREDLLQEGRIGLWSAIDGFDPYRGYQFSTYATWWIKQSINNYLLSQLPLIKVPGNVRTNQNKVLRKLREENMTLKDLIEENAKALEVTEKMLRAINASLRSKWVSSMEEPVTSDASNDSTLQDLLANPDDISLDSKVDHNALVKAVTKGLNSLPERERLILLLRYRVIDTIPVKSKSE